MSRARLAVLAVLAALACTEGTEPPIDGPFVGLAVRGAVRTSEGAPVSGASLTVLARGADSCTGLFADARTVSGADGAYSSVVQAWNSPRDVCLWIEVLPPAGSGVAADTVTVAPARLAIEADTVSVDIVLPDLP